MGISKKELKRILESTASTYLEQHLARELLALRKEREAAVPVAWLRESALKDIHKDAWTPLIVMENRRDGVDLSESYGVSFVPLYITTPAHPVAENSVVLPKEPTAEMMNAVASLFKRGFMDERMLREIYETYIKAFVKD